MIPPRSGSAARVSPPFDSQGQIAAKRQTSRLRVVPYTAWLRTPPPRRPAGECHLRAAGRAGARSSDSQFGHNPEPQPGPAPGRAGRVPSPPREAADPAGWSAPRPRTRSPYDPTPVGRCFSTPGGFGERESQPPPHTATSKRYACRAMMLVRTCSRAISHVKALCMRRAGGRRGAGPVFRAVHINADLRTRRHAEDFQYPGLWSCPHARHVVAPAPTRKCATVSGKLPSGSMWHL